MALPDRSARSRRGLRGRWRLRRQLAGIANGLANDARLAAKFAMFNALTKGEPVSGAEPLPQLRLPEFGWPLTLLFARNRRARNRPARNRPARKLASWQGRVIAIAAMAAIITGTLLLSSLGLSRGAAAGAIVLWHMVATLLIVGLGLVAMQRVLRPGSGALGQRS